MFQHCFTEYFPSYCVLTSILGDDLCQGELLAVHVLKVVLLQGPLDHLSCFVLAGQLSMNEFMNS